MSIVNATSQSVPAGPAADRAWRSRTAGARNPRAGRCPAGLALALSLVLSSLLLPGVVHAGSVIPAKSHYVLHPATADSAGGPAAPPTEAEPAEAELDAPPELLRYLEAKQCRDSEATAALLLSGIEIARQAGYATPEPLLLACLAQAESHFDDSAVGRAGERGLLQVHPCHKRAMKKLGLDYLNGAHRVAYACVLWDARGLKPWTTRRAAQRDFSAWSAD